MQEHIRSLGLAVRPATAATMDHYYPHPYKAELEAFEVRFWWAGALDLGLSLPHILPLAPSSSLPAAPF